MKEYSYTLPGHPIPLARPRYGNKKVWDSQKTLKLAASIVLLNQHQGEHFNGPLSLSATFFLQIPSSWSSKKRLEVEGRAHTSTPDLSNLLKFVEDVATGILYHDDCLIVSVVAQKVYSFSPGTQFTLKELGSGNGIRDTGHREL